MAPSPRSPKELTSLLDVLRANIGQVFLGKPEAIRLALVAGLIFVSPFVLLFYVLTGWLAGSR